MNMNKVKKKDRAAELIRADQRIFKCPVCSGSMAMENHNSLICGKGHCFDLSRTGYLNLLASRGNTVYSKELFESRRQVCLNGFFDPLIEELGKIILKYSVSSGIERPAILDAGCGEGSHLSSLSRRIRGSVNCSLFGTDIAKEGIKIAVRNDGDIVWIVADSAKLPFQDSSFNLILNTLAPANYPEFERILAPGGIIVKAVPEKSYLEELRTLIYADNSYSNDRVIDYFSNKLEVVSKHNISYRFDVDESILPYLVKMTPLTWSGDAGKLESIGRLDIPSVTVDLTLIVGRKKRKSSEINSE